MNLEFSNARTTKLLFLAQNTTPVPFLPHWLNLVLTVNSRHLNERLRDFRVRDISTPWGARWGGFWWCPFAHNHLARGLFAKGTKILLWRMYGNVIIWEGWSTKSSTLGQSQSFGHTALLPLNTYDKRQGLEAPCPLHLAVSYLLSLFQATIIFLILNNLSYL